MNPYIAYIRGRTQSYVAYLIWKCGDPHIRGFEMHVARKDWELCASLYRAERLKALR